MIVEIIISVVMLFICICVVYHYFIKQIEELENRILILEQRIENYKYITYKEIENLEKKVK